MGPSKNRIRITGVGLIVVMGLAVYLAIVAINGVPLYPYKTVTAVFPTASNLVSHDDVRINGARVGQVSKVHYDSTTNKTVVEMQVQPGHSVYANGSASIGDISALGAEFVNLVPGEQSSGPLTGMITKTDTPVEIDSLLNIFGKPQADAASASLQTLGTGFSGQQDAIHQLLSNSPTLLPNIATTTQTLTDPATALIPFIQQSQQLASSFTGRDQQLAQLLGHMDTTFQALDTQNGQAIQDTINTAAPVLPQLTPALNDLGNAAGTAAVAFTDLRPGLTALGAGTPNLRAFLRESVQPLDRVPAVANQAIPGVKGLANTLNLMQTTYPVAPFLTRLMTQANPLLSYLQPHTNDMVGLWNMLANILSNGDQYGNWLPFGISVSARSTNGGNVASTIGTGVTQDLRCAYPSPGVATALLSPGSCK